MYAIDRNAIQEMLPEALKVGPVRERAGGDCDQLATGSECSNASTGVEHPQDSRSRQDWHARHKPGSRVWCKELTEPRLCLGVEFSKCLGP